MKKKTSPIILIILLAIPIVLVLTCFTNADRRSDEVKRISTPAEIINNNISDTMPLGRTTRQIGLQIRYNTGETKQEGIFINANGLMKDMQPVDEERTLSTNNTLAHIAELAKEMDIPVYLSVLPSASTILQQNLPIFFSTVNQKNVIENIYNQFSGKLVTINSYNTLLENREKYIYYRTEDNFTPLGGYYVYKDLMRRIWVSEETLKQSGFSVEYIDNNFFGSLYQKVPYDRVSPDMIMLYHNKDSDAAHTVRKTAGLETKTYNTLYPLEAKEAGGALDIYMGGASGATDITSTNTYPANLLIFADETFLSYVPFLANHYERITVINLFEEDSNMDTIKFRNYDQILFAFDVENYTNNLDLSVLVEIIENQSR